jgi:hypothetical protein
VARSRRQWGSVRSLASGRYQACYLDPDKCRMTPAPETFATKRGADRWLAAKQTELDAGTAVDDKAGNRPLREWWPGYWRSTQSRKLHTRAGYETAWRLRIEPRFGSMPVRRIKPSHVDDWVADMIEQGLSVSKITESLGCSSVYSIGWYGIGSSPLIHARYEPSACPSAPRWRVRSPHPCRGQEVRPGNEPRIQSCAGSTDGVRRVANQRMFRNAVVRC